MADEERRTLRDLLACFSSHEPDVRVAGNVHAADAVAAIANVLLKRDAICKWTEDENGDWDTDCAHLFTFISGDPAENNFTFCPFCGKKIEDLRFN